MQEFLDRIEILEDAAKRSGYAREQVITALRKIYFNSYSGTLNYAGSAISGSSWELLIPGANIEAPVFWSLLASECQYLRQNKIITPGGLPVNMAHVFCGLDARNHPASVSLSHGIRIRSNLEALTFIGDLGCVVVKYLHAFAGDRPNTASDQPLQGLNDFYENNFLNDANMAGNADAYAINFLQGESIYSALTRYYLKGAYAGRFKELRRAIRVELNGTRNYLTHEVFNAALAYAVTNPKYRQEAIQVKSQLGFAAKSFISNSEHGSPTHAYYKACQGVVDLFLKRITSRSY